MDKLILSRTMGYICGPVGMDVPEPGEYIVRPCVNMIGLGLGAKKLYLEDTTDHLSPGHFWCEWFDGDHYSVDYYWGQQELTVKGNKDEYTLTRWDSWIRDYEKVIPFPDELEQISMTTPWINCEFIDGKLIEVHLRQNEDFNLIDGQEEFIPVWEGDDRTPPDGYEYYCYPDLHGRVGGFVK